MVNAITVDVAPAKALLAKVKGKLSPGRRQYAALQGARTLVAPIKAEAPVFKGNLQGSVTAWTTSDGGAGAGPLAPHRHLVIRDHRIVTPGGRDTGRRTTGNPFVDAAVESSKDAAMKVVADVIFGEE